MVSKLMKLPVEWGRRIHPQYSAAQKIQNIIYQNYIEQKALQCLKYLQMSKTDFYICVCIFSFEAVGATDIVDKKLYLSLFLCLFDAARHDRHCSRYISGEALITVFCPTPDIHSSAHADDDDVDDDHARVISIFCSLSDIYTACGNFLATNTAQVSKNWTCEGQGAKHRNGLFILIEIQKRTQYG